MATTTSTTDAPLIPHVHPGDLITAELINEIIDLLQPSPPSELDLPQISDAYTIDNNGNQLGKSMTLSPGSPGAIVGTNLDSVYLVRIDSVPIVVKPQSDGSLRIVNVPVPQNPTIEPGWRLAIGVLAVTNPAGSTQRIVVYSGTGGS
jgi:hypothetical protein